MVEQMHWTTENVAIGARPRYWASVLREMLYDVDLAVQAGFDAELDQYIVGPLSLNRIATSAGHEVVRSRRAITESPSSSFHLNYVRQGQFVFEQDDKKMTLCSGECVLLDGRKPYRMLSPQKTEHVCLHLPASWLQQWLPYPEEFAAKVIEKDAPWSNTLVSSINDACRYPFADADLRRICSEQVAGAIAIAFGPRASNNSHGGRQIYFRFLRVLQEKSADPELNAKAVADALGISQRYLYRILSKESTTYYNELMRVRVECAAHMLSDGRFRRVSVAEIGWRSGFRDPSHFSKRFRSSFDMTPGEYRNLALNSLE